MLGLMLDKATQYMLNKEWWVASARSREEQRYDVKSGKSDNLESFRYK